MWSTTDTVATAATVAALAQVSAAVFTAVMAGRTHDLAAKTKEMAAATEKMAAETKRVADASAVEAEATKQLVTEAQQDRALLWSPFLTTIIHNNNTNTLTPPLGLNQTITLVNLGNGQATRCSSFACEPTDVNLWCFLKHPGLRGTETIDLVAEPRYANVPMDLLQLTPHETQVDPPWAALFCEDILGNRLRFLPGRWGRDSWHEGDHPVSAWAIHPLLWQ